MKKTIFLVVMATLCLFLRGWSQSADLDYKPLKIGDRMPDLVFSNVLNSISPTLDIKGFRGRALILDFWATYCGSCVSSLSHLKVLNERYGRNISFVLVDTDPRDSAAVVKFISDRAGSGESLYFPVLVSQQRLLKLFPHRSIPHYVWVGADGRIKAVTGAEELVEENLSRLIAGLDLDLAVKGGDAK